ncbi:MAG: ABC transporter permease [Bacteroidetes bacterium]|nr:ABC transporter permease [Bacteroidota bacterium]
MLTTKFFKSLGQKSKSFFSDLGGISQIIWEITRFLPRVWRDRRLLIQQMHHIGVGSLPLVIVVGLSTGAVAAWQVAYQFKGMMSNSFVGSAVSRAIFLELGPVLTGIVIAGRVGASIAAEIGTMKVTEQIDALEVMSIPSNRFLAMPRVLAALIMLPVLVIFANTVALLGSYLVSNAFLGVSSQTFFYSVQKFFVFKDLIYGISKSIVFGGMTALVGCHIGFQTDGGAEGVGKSTIKAFVVSSASILVADYLLWGLFFE